jgi:hypothetical protein
VGQRIFEAVIEALGFRSDVTEDEEGVHYHIYLPKWLRWSYGAQWLADKLGDAIERDMREKPEDW